MLHDTALLLREVRAPDGGRSPGSPDLSGLWPRPGADPVAEHEQTIAMLTRCVLHCAEYGNTGQRQCFRCGELVPMHAYGGIACALCLIKSELEGTPLESEFMDSSCD